MKKIVDILQNLDFCIGDYLGAGRDAIVENGVELCRRMGVGGEDVAAQVAAFLDRSCRQRMQESVAWATPWRDVFDGSSISALIGSERVEGVVSLSPRRIEIHLLQPFRDASASVRIVPSAPAVYAEKVGGRITATGYGKMRLRELMVNLYFDRLSQKD